MTIIFAIVAIIVVALGGTLLVGDPDYDKKYENQQKAFKKLIEMEKEGKI